MKKKVLDNGMTVLMERVPYVSSAIIGFWVRMGSRFEAPLTHGYSHLLEHMIFKGTRKRSASEIAREVDRIGANINAATNREYTLYYIHSLGDYLNKSTSILTDMLKNSLLDTKELAREKKVVLEEIKMYEDTPSDYVSDLFMENFLADHPLGKPIIGTEQSIKQSNRTKLNNFFQQSYSNDRIIMAVAGKIDSDLFLKQAEKINLYKKRPHRKHTFPELNFKFGQSFMDRDVAQVNFIIGFPGIQANDGSRYAMYLMNTLLGGGMSSRLFQELREKQGLCYSVYSYYSTYQDHGIYAISCGTGRETLGKSKETILKICRQIRDKGVTARELKEAKTQLKGHVALAAENLEYTMNRMAIQERTLGQYVPLKTMFKEMDQVKPSDIQALALRIFGPDMNHHFTSIGPKGHTKYI